MCYKIYNIFAVIRGNGKFIYILGCAYRRCVARSDPFIGFSIVFCVVSPVNVLRAVGAELRIKQNAPLRNIVCGS